MSGIDRRQFVQAFVMGATGLLVGASCASSDDEKAGPPDSKSAKPNSREILDRLAEGGDVAMFDAVYTESGQGLEPALAVGVGSGAAIGYLCDPKTGGRWLAGSRNGDAIELKGDGGARLIGDISDATLTASLTGVGTADASYNLRRNPAATLARQKGSAAGAVPGGLIIDGLVVTGSFPNRADSDSLIGIRAVIEDRFDLAVSLKDESLTDEDAPRVEERLAEVQHHIEEMLSRGSGEVGECARVVAYASGAIVAATAGAVAALATKGDAGFEIATSVEEVQRLADSDRASEEILAFAEKHDPTDGQLVLETTRQAFIRLEKDGALQRPGTFPPLGVVSLSLT